MNVIKTGGEALGGCQQDDCWVARSEEDEPGPAKMQLLLSRLVPGRQAVWECSQEGGGLNLRWGRRVKLTRWLRDVGVAGVLHLNAAAILRGKKERVAILKRSASGENWTLRQTSQTSPLVGFVFSHMHREHGRVYPSRLFSYLVNLSISEITF